MTFLIAGDSFAQVGTEFFSITPYDYSNPDPNFVHWSRLIADKHNAHSYCIGMPGFDLKTTVFTALAKLQQHKDITHCIFHVTDWSRRLMWGVDKSNKDVATLYERLNSYAYNTREGPKLPTNYLEHYHKELNILLNDVAKTDDSDQDDKHLVHVGGDWLSHIFKTPNTYGLSNDKYQRVKQVMHSSMDHNFLSDRINYLISLIAYCNTNNIKLCLANNFSSDYVSSLSQFGTFDHFDTLECLSDNDMKVVDWGEERGNIFSHFYENEHRALALYFLKLFPHWQK